MGTLTGVRVADFSRLAPGPYASMLLADMGADVIAVSGGRAGSALPSVSRGKRLVRLDLKSEAGQAAVRRLIAEVDVVLEGFRPGVAERLGIGYEQVRRINPRVVYCSLTGYGSGGPWEQRPGHDINYVAVSGVLGAHEKPVGDPPYPPLNLLADFAGGGMQAALGIVAALYERDRSGSGQHVEAAMVDGVISMMNMHFKDWGGPLLPERGRGLLNGEAPFYRCYRCADGRYVAVGALERQFFTTLWSVVEPGTEPPDHMDAATWPDIEKVLTSYFTDRTREECAELVEMADACVTPVLDPSEAATLPNNVQRGVFDACGAPAPVPRFSRTPSVPGPPARADTTAEVLTEISVPRDVIDRVLEMPAEDSATGLHWPAY